MNNASYVIVSKTKEFLFCCNEEENGYVTSFKVMPDNRLEKVEQLVTAASMPCHLSLNHVESVLFVANYMEGSVDVVAVSEGMMKRINILQHEGNGPNMDRQEKVHAHFVFEIPNSKKICVCD